MPAKKKPVRRPRPAARRRKPKSRLDRTWKDTQSALGSAEATVEKRVKALLERSGVDTRHATETLVAWRHRLEHERKKALKQVEGRFTVLQARAKEERRALSRTVDEAVQRTLVALNIPSRHEVQELTRRLEELSQKIDRFRR
jgi:RNA polymerase-binding transcription factor DksA